MKCPPPKKTLGPGTFVVHGGWSKSAASDVTMSQCDAGDSVQARPGDAMDARDGIRMSARAWELTGSSGVCLPGH